jgi:hypothetical protein
MVKCDQCGHFAKEDFSFCPKCGAKQIDPLAVSACAYKVAIMGGGAVGKRLHFRVRV